MNLTAEPKPEHIIALCYSREQVPLDLAPAGGWRSKITTKSATGSVLAWMSTGVPFLFAGDHANAGKLVARFLYIIVRRRWRKARQLMGASQ